MALRTSLDGMSGVVSESTDQSEGTGSSPSFCADDSAGLSKPGSVCSEEVRFRIAEMGATMSSTALHQVGYHGQGTSMHASESGESPRVIDPYGCLVYGKISESGSRADFVGADSTVPLTTSPGYNDGVGRRNFDTEEGTPNDKGDRSRLEMVHRRARTSASSEVFEDGSDQTSDESSFRCEDAKNIESAERSSPDIEAAVAVPVVWSDDEISAELLPGGRNDSAFLEGDKEQSFAERIFAWRDQTAASRSDAHECPPFEGDES